jgi:hypothetical protein
VLLPPSPESPIRRNSKSLSANVRNYFGSFNKETN